MILSSGFCRYRAGLGLIENIFDESGAILVVPTNEELEIAEETVRCIQAIS